MTAEEHARLDEATIWMLEQTSQRNPREFLRSCLFCGAPFWTRRGQGRHCSLNHRVMRHYYAHREAMLARQARYHARRRAARVAA